MRSGTPPLCIYTHLLTHWLIGRSGSNGSNDTNDVEGGNAPAVNEVESVKAIVICSGPENDHIDIHLKKVGIIIHYILITTYIYFDRDW